MPSEILSLSKRIRWVSAVCARQTKTYYFLVVGVLSVTLRLCLCPLYQSCHKLNKIWRIFNLVLNCELKKIFIWDLKSL